jgi:hypothetical protein
MSPSLRQPRKTTLHFPQPEVRPQGNAVARRKLQAKSTLALRVERIANKLECKAQGL